MKNKILSYLLGAVLILSMWFVTWYVNAQADSSPSSYENCLSKCPENPTNLADKQLCIAKCDAEYKKDGTENKNECKDWCCGIKLNTNFPGLWNCIEYSQEKSAFPKMMGILTKLIMSIILVICFIMIIVAWIMWASDDPKGAQNIIKKVAITILLLWFSGVILRLINPNFFG